MCLKRLYILCSLLWLPRHPTLDPGLVVYLEPTGTESNHFCLWWLRSVYCRFVLCLGHGVTSWSLWKVKEFFLLSVSLIFFSSSLTILFCHHWSSKVDIGPSSLTVLSQSPTEKMRQKFPLVLPFVVVVFDLANVFFLFILNSLDERNPSTLPAFPALSLPFYPAWFN